jgi:hypothetical protein
MTKVCSAATASSSTARVTKSGILAGLLCGAVLCAAPLPAWAKHWTFTVNSTTNQTGGVLYLSGSGWATSGQVTISTVNPPGQAAGTYPITKLTLDKGKFNATINWSLGLGCPYNVGFTTVDIIAVGPTKGKLSRSTSTTVQNCQIWW